MELIDSDYGEFALTFAKSLVAGDYEAAYKMLSDSLKEEITVIELKNAYRRMVAYFASPPDYTELINPVWRYEELDCWAYVSIACDGYLEAVTVGMIQKDGNIVICEIQWGRP